jgi:two-component SAPR family response regulator
MDTNNQSESPFFSDGEKMFKEQHRLFNYFCKAYPQDMAHDKAVKAYKKGLTLDSFMVAEYKDLPIEWVAQLLL